MRAYIYRKSDMCYTGSMEYDPEKDVLPLTCSFDSPPAKLGYHAVMTGSGWKLEAGPTPPDPQPQMDLDYWRSITSCTPLQGRLALSNAGHLNQVETIMNDPSTKQEVKIAWEYATVWYRSSPMIETLAAALNLSDTQVDDLFKDAQKISV